MRNLSGIAITLSLLVAPPAYAERLSDEHGAAVKQHVLTRLNVSRAEHGLPPLSYSTKIQRVAQGHADDLATHLNPASTETREATYLAHTSSDGRNLQDRYRDAQVETGWQFAENVGYWIREPFVDPLHQPTSNIEHSSTFGIDLMHDGMMAEVPPNDSHRENILGDYTHVGIGLSLLREEDSHINAIFMVTNFSRYQEEEVERSYRIHKAMKEASSRSLQSYLEPPHGGPFLDVSPNHVFASAISAMKEHGLIHGNPDGTFKPEHSVNRAEIAKMLLDSISLSPIGMEFNACFSDVFNQWFAPYVCIAKRKGWITGYGDGTYRPEQTVSRAEGAALTARVFAPMQNNKTLKLYNDVPLDSWFAEPVQALASNNLIPFTGNWFAPTQGMKRAEVTAMLYLAVQKQRKEVQGVLPKPKGPARNLRVE